MASHLRSLPVRALSSRSHSLNYVSAGRNRSSRTPVLLLHNSAPAIPPRNSYTTPPSALQRRTMATETPAADAPKKYEWLVVIPDFPGAHEKRMAVRPQHFAGLKPFLESGQYQMGGAVLNEVPQGSDPSRYSFAGSTIVMEAASRDEVMAVLRQDVYAKSGVWDVENAQIWPLLCAFRKPK